MKLSTFFALGSALLLLYACSSDEQLFGATPATTNTDGGAGGMAGAGGTGGMAGAGGTGGMAGAGGEGGMMFTCENEPQDSSCIVCLKRDCCQVLTECRPNMQCMCWVECVEDGMSNFECLSRCGGDAPAEFVALDSCATMSCSTQCKW